MFEERKFSICMTKMHFRNAERKLERPLSRAIPCKSSPKWHHESDCEDGDHIWKDSTNGPCVPSQQGVEYSHPKKHENHTTDKGLNSMSQTLWYTSWFHMPQVMKIPDVRAAAGKDWERSRRSQHDIRERSRARRRFFWKHKETSPLRNMGHRSSEKCAVGTPIREVQRWSRVPWWHLKDDSGIWSVPWTGPISISSNARKVMNLFCKMTVWSQVQLEVESECPDVWIRLPRLTLLQSWANIEDSLVSWTKLVQSSISRIAIGERIRRSFVRTWMGENSESKRRVISLQYVGEWHKKWMERSRMSLPCGREWWKMWTLTNRHHFLTMYIGMYLTWMHAKWKMFSIFEDVWIT